MTFFSNYLKKINIVSFRGLILKVFLTTIFVILLFFGIHSFISNLKSKLTSKKSLDKVITLISKLANEERFDLTDEQKIKLGKDLNTIFIKLKPVINQIDFIKKAKD